MTSGEMAQRLTGEREICPVHGMHQVIYDLNTGLWRCLGSGEHWPTGRHTKLSEAMKADMKKLGVKMPEEDDTEVSDKPKPKPKTRATGGRDSGRTDMTWFTNAKGDRRLKISVSYDTANLLAQGQTVETEKFMAALERSVDIEYQGDST